MEPMILEGRIKYPYVWAVGKAAARFLTELKNGGRIVGVQCPACRKILVPPFDVCGECFVETDGAPWFEVGPCGDVTAWTVVHKPGPWAPAAPPFAIVRVRLDGADADLVHIVKNPDDRLRTGARVEAAFAPDAPPGILNIETFRITDKPKDPAFPIPIEEFEAKPIYELKGSLEVPYSWSYGESSSRFFTETRDNKRILGARCTKCKGVLIPPTSACGQCFAPTEEELVPVADRGELVSWTVVYLPFPGQPTEPPYCYGMIRLDGADTLFPHLVKGAKENDWSDLAVGMRVRAVWNEERKGDLYDIKWFEGEADPPPGILRE